MIDMFLQIGYANRLGVTLTNFKQKKPRTWEFSHSCETKHGNKKLRSRAYIYEAKDGLRLNVACHHCGMSTSLGSFMKETNPSLYNEYRFEAYKTPTDETPTPLDKPIQLMDANLDGLIPVISLPKSSSVLKFLERRKIPQDKYHLLYVAKNFYAWATKYNDKFAKSEDKSPRLVIPFFDMHGRVIGFTARTFSPAVEPRYIHLRIDRDVEFIYGVERVDASRTIYVVEGQIDSLFVDNAVAVGGSSYSSSFLHKIKSNCVIVPDNDWCRNRQVGKQVKKVIDEGYKVCIMPSNIIGKDLNDFVRGGMSISELKQTIDKNTYIGAAAVLHYAFAKKF